MVRLMGAPTFQEMIARSSATGPTTAASSCSRTTPRSGPGRSIRRRSCARSARRRGRRPTSSRRSARPTDATARTRSASSSYYQYQVLLKPAPEDVLDLYFASLEAVGIDLREARRAPRRGRLGGPDARRLGARLGGLGRRHGGDAVHVLPAARRPRARPDPGRDHLRARAAGHVPAGQADRLRARVGAGRHLGRRLPRERAPVVGLQLRGGAGGRAHAPLRRARGRVPRARRARACRCRPTTRCSSARTRSTCWTRAARSP